MSQKRSTKVPVDDRTQELLPMGHMDASLDAALPTLESKKVSPQRALPTQPSSGGTSLSGGRATRDPSTKSPVSVTLARNADHTIDLSPSARKTLAWNTIGTQGVNQKERNDASEDTALKILPLGNGGFVVPRVDDSLAMSSKGTRALRHSPRSQGSAATPTSLVFSSEYHASIGAEVEDDFENRLQQPYGRLSLYSALVQWEQHALSVTDCA